MEAREREHLLAVKVMRLTRPTLYSSIPISCDRRDLPSNLFQKSLQNDLASAKDFEQFSLGNMLMLPQSFGNIYLGETFSCYLSVCNESQEKVLDVAVRADLIVGTHRFQLMKPDGEVKMPALEPDRSVDAVIHHDVKEIGTHKLFCTVSYTSDTGEKVTFRRRFEFQVSKPLDVKTKFYNAEDFVSDEVYLEAQLQNITQSPVCLEKVSLEASSHFTVRQLNTVRSSDGDMSVFGDVNCVNPMDSRQYLFCMSPKEEVKSDVKLWKGVTGIGKMDIVWRSAMGDCGHLQTSQLERMSPGYGDIRLTVDEIPSLATLEKPFHVGFQVLNCCERTINLVLHLENKYPTGLIWQGLSGRQLGEIEPQKTMAMRIEAVPLATGLLSISGIKLMDVFLKRTYDYDEIAQVFVRPQEA